MNDDYALPHPPVLLLHGIGCTGATLAKLRSAILGLNLGILVEAPTLALSQRNAAVTDRGGTPLFGLLELLVEAESHVEAVRRSTGLRPILIGHSNGALLALALAARGLAAGALLVAPAPPPSVGGAPLWLRRLLFRRVFGSGWHQRWVGFGSRGANVPPPDVGTTLLLDSGRVMDEVLSSRPGSPFDPDPPLPCPLAVLAGGKDRLVPVFLARRIATRFGGTFEAIAKADHWLICDPDAAKMIACLVGSLAGSALPTLIETPARPIGHADPRNNSRNA